MSKPKAGESLFNLSGSIIGVVVRVEGNLCHYKNNKGNDDLFIWRSSYGLNKNVFWSEK